MISLCREDDSRVTRYFFGKMSRRSKQNSVTLHDDFRVTKLLCGRVFF